MKYCRFVFQYILGILWIICGTLSLWNLLNESKEEEAPAQIEE